MTKLIQAGLLAAIWLAGSIFIAYPNWIISMVDVTSDYSLQMVLLQQTKWCDRSYFLLSFFVLIDYVLSSMLYVRPKKQMLFAISVFIVIIFIVLATETNFRLWQYYVVLGLLWVIKIAALLDIREAKPINIIVVKI